MGALPCYEFVRNHRHAFGKTACLLCLAVIAIALAGMADHLAETMAPDRWPFSGGSAPAYSTSVSIILLAAGLLMCLSSRFAQSGGRTLLIGWLLLPPFVISSYVLGGYIYSNGLTLHAALMQKMPADRMAFLASLSLFLSSIAALLVWRFRHIETVMFFAVGSLSLLVFNISLFALLGHYEDVPVLYNFTMSVPMALGFLLLSWAVLIGSTPYGGLLLPLFSESAKGRLLAWIGIVGGFTVMLKGVYDIHHLNSFAAIRQADRLHVDFLVSAMISMLLAPAIKSVSLRAVHYYNESRLYARQQVEMRAALQYQSDLTRMIAENASSALFLLDSANHCTYMNPEAEKMLGLTLKDVQGRCMHEVTHYMRPDGTPYPVSECPINQSLTSGKPLLEYEDYLIRANGEFFPVICSARPVISNHRVKAMVMEVRDVTRRKKDEEKLRLYTERLEQSNRNLEHFAYVASHDLQSPLRKIVALSDILIKDLSPGLEEEHRDFLDRIHSSASRMQLLVNDLLLLARVGTARQPLQSVDMGEVLEHVLHDLETEIKTTDARIETGPMMTLEAVEVQMYQLLKNLVENALKYHREGVPPVVRVSMHPVPFDCCQLIVEDNGIGFEQEKAEKIFELFVRLHGKEKYEGTGIGLTICKMVVEQHEGNIEVRSIPGQGTTFFVNLPLKHEYKPAHSQPARLKPHRYIHR